MTTYNDQQKEKCFARIRDICTTLPSFCSAYINAVATKKDTSFRTGMQYAYEIRTFINFMAVRESVSPKEVTLSHLDALLPLDIDDYISHLASYETLEDRQHNEVIKKERRAHQKDKIEGSGTDVKERVHGKSAAARARSLAAVRGLYKYLEKNRMVTHNPAVLADIPIKQKKPVICLTPEEVGQTLDNVQNTRLPSRRQVKFAQKQSLRDTAIITLLLHTGIRASECAGLDLQDLDFVTNAARILRKGGELEYVYFNAQTREALQDYIDNERKDPEADRDALFVNRFGARLSTQGINNIVKKYTNGVSLNKITTHKMRSTYASTLYKQNGGDIMMVKDALGHDSWVVQKYVDNADANRHKAGKTIDYAR